MCLAWGALIPIGVVIATFRTVRGASAWWFHLHRILNILGLLVSLAGLSVGVYLDPGEGGLTWKHKIIGITVNVLAVVQVCCSDITPATCHKQDQVHHSLFSSCMCLMIDKHGSDKHAIDKH